jgi:hypothetical protein
MKLKIWNKFFEFIRIIFFFIFFKKIYMLLETQNKETASSIIFLSSPDIRNLIMRKSRGVLRVSCLAIDVLTRLNLKYAIKL